MSLSLNPKQTEQLKVKRTESDSTFNKRRSKKLGVMKIRKPKETRHLARYIVNSPLTTKSLMKLFVDSNNEDLPISLAWVFVVNGRGNRIVRFCIESEINNTDDYRLLLREETAYIRVLSTYTSLEGYYYIKNIVGKIIRKIITNKHGSLEIDPNKVSGEDILIKNRQALLKVCKDMMSSLLKSASNIPTTIQDMLCLAYNAASSKFNSNTYRVLGSCFFLRFVVPNMVQPEKYGLCKELTREQRRNIILCSKVLQLVANETEPTDKEQYMIDAGLGNFVSGNIKKLHIFYDKILKKKKGKKVGNYISVLSSSELSDIYINGHMLRVFDFFQVNFPVLSSVIEEKSKDKQQASTEIENIKNVMEDCFTKSLKLSSEPTMKYDSLM